MGDEDDGDRALLEDLSDGLVDLMFSARVEGGGRSTQRKGTEEDERRMSVEAATKR
jgi:hypothetical protein